MNMRPEIMILLAAILLASQVAVIIALVVLCKRFKTLKDEVNKYKIKKNRQSLPSLVIKDPKEKSTRPSNEYVDGRRHPTTFVRTNSKESIVYVPTPEPDRRSKNLDENGYELNVMQGAGDASTSYNDGANVNSSYTQDQEDEIYGNQVVIDMVEKGGEAEQTLSTGEDSIASNSNDPSTPCIEEINLNPGYTQDTDEIYGNQVAIDMAENRATSSGSGNEQKNTSNVNVRNGPKSKKSNKHKSASKKVKSEKLNTSTESERTIEAGESYYEGDNTDANNEPIYENLRGQIGSLTNA